MQISLASRNTPDSIAEVNSDGHFIMTIPGGRKGKYRWAQFDDYLHRLRRNFEWQPPCRLSLMARCNNTQHAGTWGFGFWNDPFNTNLGVSGSVRRLPALPNCAWFFYASEHNYLSFHDHLPAQGFLAATFSSHRIPPLFLSLGIPFFPLLFWKGFTRVARYGLATLIRQDAVQIQMDVTEWHSYQIDWGKRRVTFTIDGQTVLDTVIHPFGRQGLVIWVDNQYAAFPPEGKLLFGTLATTESTTLEIGDLQIY
ncbi:MAG: hypothetical protein CVU40_07705 [Chloroflexi bacterium HGW-Chloroflexi-2]|jgi:hypothetical protein|nr:MAG: hypothetical protein CVU40_07705 [Chloroflexi bacterium HGW-Chloroflexi-2]